MAVCVTNCHFQNMAKTISERPINKEVIYFLILITYMVTLIVLHQVKKKCKTSTSMMLQSLNQLEKEIEERKLAEKRLYESLDLLTKKNEQLSNFAHILSHNIRNHANNIHSLSNLIDTSSLNRDNAETFQKLIKVSIGLNNTLNDLSTAIKIRENILIPELLSFKKVTNDVLEVLNSDITSNNAILNIDFQTDTVSFPKIYLHSIIMNLLSNSLKYRKPQEPPIINFRSYVDKNLHTVLECSDNGLGIDMDLNGLKIFGLYKTFHDHEKANGVGLFLVKNQLESQGATIEVASELNKGTTFTIRFKRSEPTYNDKDDNNRDQISFIM